MALLTLTIYKLINNTRNNTRNDAIKLYRDKLWPNFDSDSSDANHYNNWINSIINNEQIEHKLFNDFLNNEWGPSNLPDNVRYSCTYPPPELLYTKGIIKLIEWMKKDENIKYYKSENYNI